MFPVLRMMSVWFPVHANDVCMVKGPIGMSPMFPVPRMMSSNVPL